MSRWRTTSTGEAYFFTCPNLSTPSICAALFREVIAVNEEQDRPQIQASRVVLVHGKGMGVNTVTALLAYLAAGMGRYVSCIDLDADFGSLALALDTQPERGLAQFLKDPDAADALAVERLQVQVSTRIGLLAHPVDLAGQASFEQHGLDNLIRALTSHAHLILACGASMYQLAAIRHLVTNHLIVFEPTPAGVSIAVRWLRILEGATSSLIMNHARPLPKVLGEDHLRSAFAERLPDLEIPYMRNMAGTMALGEPRTCADPAGTRAAQPFSAISARRGCVVTT